MDTNNWWLTQGGEPFTVKGDWRSQLQADSRQAIVNKIMETLKRHIPAPGQELKEIALKFEEKIFTAATSQSEYLRKISLKMLAMETKSQNPISNSLQSNSASNGQNQPDLASQSMQSLLNSQGTPLPVPGPTNRSQAGQQQDVPEQQQQLSLNPQQYLYQQHLQNQLMKQKFQQGSISHSQMQSHIQQQQQQNLIQRNQLQQNQQPGIMQSSQLSSLQQRQLLQSQSALPEASSSVMDTSNWRPTQVGELSMDSSDWKRQLQADSRQRIVNKIMDTLKRHLPFTGQEGQQELEKIAVRFEEKIYTAATSQSDYLRKISLKMLTMETKIPRPILSSPTFSLMAQIFPIQSLLIIK